MMQSQPQLDKATPRQIAGVSARVALGAVLAFAGTLVAAVPFPMPFAKSCPDLLEHGFALRMMTFFVTPCSTQIDQALSSFGQPGLQFIASAFLLFAMVGILRRRRARVAARRHEE